MEEKELLSLGIEIVSAMKAACYGVSIEEGRELALENTNGDSKMEIFERKMLHDQALFVANATLNYLSARNPEPRPSDGLLWEAWKAAISHSLIRLEGSRQNSNESFALWLATLPPDPLADDRATLANAINEGTANFISKSVADAAARLAGMEVGHD